MPTQPRTQQEIFNAIASDIDDDIYGITNFTTNSFNAFLLSAYAQRIRQLELKLLAAELAGSVDYAGKELTQGDLNRLGIENVLPEEINRYMQDDDLDSLAANFSTERFGGAYSTGTVTFEVTDSNATITHGFEVAARDSDGNEQIYYCDVDGSAIVEPGRLDLSSTATADAESYSTNNTSGYEITTDVVAAEVGTEYNLGKNAITIIPNPQPGIIEIKSSSVVDGGRNRESTPEFRERVQNALFNNSRGGTTNGIKGALRTRVTDPGIDSAELNEFVNKEPPYTDVVVSGGDTQQILDVIDQFKPSGVKHNFLRPTDLSIRTLIDVTGDDADESSIEDTVASYFDRLSVGETVWWSEITGSITSGDQIGATVSAQNAYIESVTNERFVYDHDQGDDGDDDAQSIYPLNRAPMGRVVQETHLVRQDRIDNGFELGYAPDGKTNTEIIVIENGNEKTVADADYTLTGTDNKTLELDAAAPTPDTDTLLRVSYDTNKSPAITAVYEVDDTVDGTGTSKTEIDSGKYNLIDDSGSGYKDAIEFTTTFSEDKRISVNYEPLTTFQTNLVLSNVEQATSGTEISRILPR